MSTKLAKAVKAIERLPQERQNEFAEAIFETATRSLVDEKIAVGEASYAEHGGIPIREVFDRLIAKHAG